jgi:hypothetical protein
MDQNVATAVVISTLGTPFKFLRVVPNLALLPAVLFSARHFQTLAALENRVL